MINFPIFRNISVQDYGLFPSSTGDHKFSFDFKPGVSLVVGVNGLGKTTLLTMLLRSLTGPFDLQQAGAPEELGAILSEKPVKLDRATLRFFSQRVADRAEHATVKVDVSFGDNFLRIKRHLSDLKLIDLSLNGEVEFLPQSMRDRESKFQRVLCELMSLTSFVDVLLVLHYVVFLTERRPGALWDENAQRQLLRAILLEPGLAEDIPFLERRTSQADGAFRRARSEANKYEKQLSEAQTQVEISPAVRAKLKATQESLSADRERLEELEDQVISLERQRKEERLTFERAKIVREEAEAAVERQKYTTLLRLFPSMDDAARLTIIRVLTDEECLVCGSNVEGKRAALEKQIQEGLCPACGSPTLGEENVITPDKLESVRLDKHLERANLAKVEAERSSAALNDIVKHYDEAIKKAIALRASIEEKAATEQVLVGQLPKSSSAVSRLEQTVAFLREEADRHHAKGLEARAELADAYASAKRSFAQRTKGLAERFSEIISMMISEEAELVRGQTSAKITQDGEAFEVFGFVPEMTAADRPGKARRELPIDVSESQRELIDLAFRIALIGVAGQGQGGTLVMETPEASLDAIAMDRVGQALFDFAHRNGNYLIATSNLTNTQMISAMFGGPQESKRSLNDRKRRTLSLLDEAAPNRSVEKDYALYQDILARALKGEQP